MPPLSLDFMLLFGVFLAPCVPILDIIMVCLLPCLSKKLIFHGAKACGQVLCPVTPSYFGYEEV